MLTHNSDVRELVAKILLQKMLVLMVSMTDIIIDKYQLLKYPSWTVRLYRFEKCFSTSRAHSTKLFWKRFRKYTRGIVHADLISRDDLAMLIPDVGVTLGTDTRLYRRVHNRGTSIENSEVCALTMRILYSKVFRNILWEKRIRFGRFHYFIIFLISPGECHVTCTLYI